MKILFTVQGEGRGHMTQALALKTILNKHGHEIIQVITGKHDHRELPEYFANAWNNPIIPLPSPSFVFEKGKGLSLLKTAIKNIQLWPAYHKSSNTFKTIVEQTNPDLIINFFEPLAGLYRITGGKKPIISIGHQFMLQHPQGFKTQKMLFQQLIMRTFTNLVATDSPKIALSYIKQHDILDRNLFVAPPLLRTNLFNIEPTNKNFILIYLVNSGYAEQIIQWNKNNPQTELHCFCDKIDTTKTTPNLSFHQLNATKFLHMMSQCTALACSAGFESVSEALFLQKPLLLIPVKNHLEQNMNASECVKLGFAIQDTQFNLDKLKSFKPKTNLVPFKNWISQAESCIMKHIHTICKVKKIFNVSNL